MAEPFWQRPLSYWTGERIREFLDEGNREGDHLEYKGAYPRRDGTKWQITDDLLETIAAFANTTDGLIFVGVDADEAGYPVKMTDLLHPKPEAALRDRCASDIEPTVYIDTALVPVPGADEELEHTVMLVRVRRGANPPYVQRQRGVFLRNDEHDRQARRADLDALYSRRMEHQGEFTSPWTQVTSDISLTANQIREEPWPVISIGLTPTFPQPPIELGSLQDAHFRELCQNMLEYRGEPYLEPGSVSIQPNEQNSGRFELSTGRAWAEGTISVRRYFTLANQDDAGVRAIQVVPLWRTLRLMLEQAAVWPRGVCGAEGLLLYWIAVGNIANSTLVLPANGRTLLSPGARGLTLEQTNKRPGYITRGEWPSDVDVDDIIEAEFKPIARLLQCIWWEQYREQIRQAASS